MLLLLLLLLLLVLLMLLLDLLNLHLLWNQPKALQQQLYCLPYSFSAATSPYLQLHGSRNRHSDTGPELGGASPLKIKNVNNGGEKIRYTNFHLYVPTHARK